MALPRRLPRRTGPSFATRSPNASTRSGALAGRNRVDKRPKALQDLADIAVYLAQESGRRELAFRFLDTAEAAFAQLGRMPGLGVARPYRDPELAGLRMWPISGFENYLIFYRPKQSGIEIIRVLHAKRNIDGLLGA